MCTLVLCVSCLTAFIKPVSNVSILRRRLSRARRPSRLIRSVTHTHTSVYINSKSRNVVRFEVNVSTDAFSRVVYTLRAVADTEQILRDA